MRKYLEKYNSHQALSLAENLRRSGASKSQMEAPQQQQSKVHSHTPVRDKKKRSEQVAGFSQTIKPTNDHTMKRIIDFTMNLSKALNSKEQQRNAGNKFRTIDPKMADLERHHDRGADRTAQADDRSRNQELSMKEEIHSSKPYRDNSLEDHLSSISQKQVPVAAVD